MPEPKDRSFAELDLLFEKRVPARKFGKTSVDVFGETNVEGTTVFGRYEEKVADAVHRTESISGAKM
jgi:SP family general alpha glucoside:H+ symporter-like MFS transporter